MDNKKLINTLGECVTACDYCANACLNKNHVQEMVNCMRVNHVCAEVCSALHQLLVMDYEEVKELVMYCIKVCNDCAEECEKHDQEHCVKCAKACRQCAVECQEFLS